MPSNWRQVTLGDVCRWLSGGTPSKSNANFWGGDIPWHSAASMHELRLGDSALSITKAGLEAGSQLAPEGSTLLLVRGMSLHKEIRVAHAMRDIAFNQDVKALVAGPDMDPWFLTWILMAKRDELLGWFMRQDMARVYSQRTCSRLYPLHCRRSLSRSESPRYSAL